MGKTTLIVFTVFCVSSLWSCKNDSRILSDYDEKKKISNNLQKLNESVPLRMRTNHKDLVTGMDFVWVPGGNFQMGSNESENEKPIHKVTLRGYWMAKYELTQSQWQKIMGYNPSVFNKMGLCTSSNCPVETISWEDVKTFISKLNRKSSAKYRLPTEAEWEYACRSGGKDQKFCGGNNIKSLGWYDVNSGDKTHPVGKKIPNGLGLYDMSGNVWEWVEDKYGKSYYGIKPVRNPKGPIEGFTHVIRGSSWVNKAWNARSAKRKDDRPDHRSFFIGARLVMVSQTE
jgi:formylglycine-generating enzyme required for sulfatase activity